MAKGYDRNAARRQEAAALGRELSRRARSKCELCGSDGSLRVIEIPPLLDDPSVERAALLCSQCQRLAEEEIPKTAGSNLQFLREAVWSETLPAQLLAVRLARQLSRNGEAWARETVDGLYLEPEVEALL
jgi:protein PhnA